MKCLVTGGAGFIGSHLVDQLISNNNEVVVIDNESAEQNKTFYWNEQAKNYNYDICNYEKIQPLFKDIDWVFHLAANARIQPSFKDPTKTFEVNSLGTNNILRASADNKIRKFIYSSTSSAYGMKNNPPYDETMEVDWTNPYTLSKIFGEKLCELYSKCFGLKTIILRYFNVYGERQPINGNYATVIGKFLKQKQENIPLTIVGNGEQKRDFTYIDDIIKANILLATNEELGNADVFNIGTGENHSILDLIKYFNSGYVYVPERKGESKETLANISKLYNHTKWKPQNKLKKWINNNI